MRANRLVELAQEFFHERRTEGLFAALRLFREDGNGVRHHSVKIRVSAPCATSLSPRPLTHKSTGSSFFQRPAFASIQATAWAVSSAGITPSSRAGRGKGRSAWSSGVET